MAQTWPGSLPNSLKAGYTIDQADGRIMTDMEQGPPRFRLQYENTPITYSVSFLLTAAQLATLRAFFMTTLAGGVLSVDLPVQDETGVHTAEVKFLTSPLSPRLAGDKYRVSATVITV